MSELLPEPEDMPVELPDIPLDEPLLMPEDPVLELPVPLPL